MVLSPDDAALVHRLMDGVRAYVCNQAGLPAPEADDDHVRAREALFANMGLLDRYVRDNPDRLPPEELEAVGAWKHAVHGIFYITRFLKKGAIFVGDGRPQAVYQVLGLRHPVKDLLPPMPVPIIVKTALIPFRDQIVHDGYISSYSIYTGAGIKREINEAYQAARQNGRILTCLGTVPSGPPPRPKRGPDYAPVLHDIATMAARLKGGPTPCQGPAMAVLKAAIEVAQAATERPDDLDHLWRLTSKVNRAAGRLKTVINRTEL